MSAGHETANGGSETLVAGSSRSNEHGRGSGTSALFAATALYLVVALLWSSIGRDDGSYLTAAAIVAAVAASVSLVVVALAAQTEHLISATWSWTFLVLALLAISAAQISEAAVSVTRAQTVWNPPLLLGLHVVAAVALFVSLPLANVRFGLRLTAQLPSLCGAAIVGIAPMTALTLAGRLLTGSAQSQGTILATSLPLTACMIVATSYLASAIEKGAGASTAEFGFALGAAGWAGTVLVRQLGEWQASNGLIALSHWLLPVAALGFSAAAFSSITKRDVLSCKPVRVPRAITSERAIVVSLAALLAVATVGYLMDQVIDFALIAAIALATYVARQALTIRLTRQQVRSILEANEDLERAANLDKTTGLPNRAALDVRMREEFERAFRYEQPLSLCVIDIDHFKSVNDRFGHPVGDIVLRAIARSLRQSARGIDFVGRYGGEEFVVVAPGTWSADAEILAERLRAHVDRLVFTSVSGKSLRVTVSIGVAGYPEHAADLEALFALADRALYQSKQCGRNRVTLHGKDRPD